MADAHGGGRSHDGLSFKIMTFNIMMIIMMMLVMSKVSVQCSRMANRTAVKLHVDIEYVDHADDVGVV